MSNRVYRSLFAAQITSLVGTGVTTVALGLIAYHLAGANAGLIMGAIFTLKMLAYVFVAPVSAAILHRVSARHVLIGSDLIRVAATVSLPFAHSQVHLFIAVFCLHAAAATFTPALQATLPRILPREDDYTRALSLTSFAYNIEGIASPVLTAGLLFFIQPSNLLLGVTIGCAASAVIIMRIPTTNALDSPRAPAESQTTANPATKVPSFWSRTLLGARLMVTTPALRSILAFNLAIASAGSILIAGLWFLMGASSSMAQVPIGRLIRRHVEPGQLTSAMAGQFALSHACWLLTYPLVGALTTQTPATAAVVMTLIAIVACLTGILLKPTQSPRGTSTLGVKFDPSATAGQRS